MLILLYSILYNYPNTNTTLRTSGLSVAQVVSKLPIHFASIEKFDTSRSIAGIDIFYWYRPSLVAIRSHDSSMTAVGSDETNEDSMNPQSFDNSGTCTDGPVRRKRGPYIKLYNLNPEDESYNATIPRTTKWRRVCCDRDKETSDDQTSTTEQDEELQSQCSSSLQNEDQDLSGANIFINTSAYSRPFIILGSVIKIEFNNLYILMVLQMIAMMIMAKSRWICPVSRWKWK